MSRPKKLDDATIDRWVATHPGWDRVSQTALAKTFKLPTFAAALDFVVRVGKEADRRDHHPDVELGWGRARFLWTTHDAGGITQLDLELAEATEKLAG